MQGSTELVFECIINLLTRKEWDKMLEFAGSVWNSHERHD